MSDGTLTMPGPQAAGGLGRFERYLSVWVALCMAAGVLLGKALPSAVSALRDIEFGKGSHINLPIAVLIWLMITPMMMKVDFGSIRNVGRKPAGLFVTLFVNWIVKPFSMAALAWLFFRVVFRCLSYPRRSRSIHRRMHYPGSRSLYRDGFRLEPSHERRPRVHAGSSLRQRLDHAGVICPNRSITG